MIARAPQRVRESVILVRQTVLPPERDSPRARMGIAAGVVAGVAGLGYAFGGGPMGAFMAVVVGFPVVILPCVVLAGMVLGGRERRRRESLVP